MKTTTKQKKTCGQCNEFNTNEIQINVNSSKMMFNCSARFLELIPQNDIRKTKKKMLNKQHHENALRWMFLFGSNTCDYKQKTNCRLRCQVKLQIIRMIFENKTNSMKIEIMKNNSKHIHPGAENI